MTTKSEGKHTGEFIVSEAPGTGSRDTGTLTVPANTTLEAGTVVGQVGSSSKYVQFDDTLSDGGQTAAGVLYDTTINDTDAAVDVEGAVIVNLNAEVRAADLVWGAGADSAAGLVDLRALGIKAR